jgi:hypothetical protein
MIQIVKIPTVQELRQQGWKVRVKIFRKPTKHSDPELMAELRENNWTDKLEPCGGRVEVEILSPEGVETKGVAVCNENDPFVRKIGRSLAIARALNIQPPEPKLKVGDEVWFLDVWVGKIKKRPISGISYDFRFDETSCDFKFIEQYSFEGVWAFGPVDVGATKEELLAKLAEGSEDE